MDLKSQMKIFTISMCLVGLCPKGHDYDVFNIFFFMQFVSATHHSRSIDFTN